MKRPRKRVALRIDKIFPASDAEDRYWRAIGRLFDMFSLAELALNIVIIKYAKVNVDTARALFLPLRVDAATGMLHRIIETKKLRGERIKELDAILSHLGQVARVRNDIAHLGITSRGTQMQTTNAIFARSRKKMRTTKLSYRTFDQINYDLHDIVWRLMKHAGALKQHPGDNDLTRILKRALRATYRKPLHVAWHYKPRSPLVHRQTHLRQPPKLQHQH